MSILPVMTCAAETWSLSVTQLKSLAIITQRNMKRQVTVGTLLDHKTNTWIRQQTIEDIRYEIKESKHRWAGHVARMSDNRWTPRATVWQFQRLFQRERD